MSYYNNNDNDGYETPEEDITQPECPNAPKKGKRQTLTSDGWGQVEKDNDARMTDDNSEDEDGDVEMKDSLFNGFTSYRK